MTFYRSLSTGEQAALALRWYLDDTRPSQLACGNVIAVSTAYNYRDEWTAVTDCWPPRLLDRGPRERTRAGRGLADLGHVADGIDDVVGEPAAGLSGPR